jgi:hypothetical protein
MYGPYVFVKDQFERVVVEDRINGGDDGTRVFFLSGPLSCVCFDIC